MNNYLSQKVKNVWLVLVLAIAEAEDSIPNMSNDLTKDETKWLKTSITLVRKAYNSMSDRLGEKAVKQLHRYALNSNIQVMSREMSRAITNRELKEDEITKIETSSLIHLATNLIAAKCEECEKDFNHCPTFEILDDVGIEGYCVNKNCPYSFGEKKKEDKANKVSSRKQKKMKNKYDDDTEIYKYNFETKIK